ncbi:hypothetical protein Tco_1161709 [Tanacetum coccineum]
MLRSAEPQCDLMPHSFDFLAFLTAHWVLKPLRPGRRRGGASGSSGRPQENITPTNWDASLPFGMITGTIGRSRLKSPKTGQRAWSYAGRDPGHLLASEIIWLQTRDGLCALHRSEEILANRSIRGKQRGGILLGVGRMLDQFESSPEFRGASGSDGCGDDEPGDDEEGDEDEEDGDS